MEARGLLVGEAAHGSAPVPIRVNGRYGWPAASRARLNLAPYQTSLVLFLIFFFGSLSVSCNSLELGLETHQCVQVDSSPTLVPVRGGGCWPFEVPYQISLFLF